jgi:hypothetical protein
VVIIYVETPRPVCAVFILLFCCEVVGHEDLERYWFASLSLSLLQFDNVRVFD